MGNVIDASAADQLHVGALRRLIRADTEEDVLEVVADVVRAMGGSLVAPELAGGHQLPIDLTLGGSEPLVPTAPNADVLADLAVLVPPIVEDARLALARVRLHSQLAESAATDPLTGLGNRRLVMRTLRRLAVGDVVVMLDLDHFKAVNDTLGHETGDAVLRIFGAAVAEVIRAADTAGRFGGEEFVFILPRTTIEGAQQLLDRLRAVWDQRRPQPVTFSAGIADVASRGGRDALRRADVALYRAKDNGRDRWEVAIGE